MGPPSRALGVWVLLVVAQTAWSQVEPPLPPRVLDDEPGEAILAQLPEDREPELEEIVVVGESQWRLPDLGGSWRTENEPPEESRLAVRFPPLYDPELAGRLPDIFQVNRQQERIGYLEFFRIRFGAQPQRTIVPTVTDPNP